MTRLFAKGDDPDALYGAWTEDGMPVQQSTREVPRPESGPPNPFWAHLEHCSRCADHPFDLCADGARLLQQAALGHEPCCAAGRVVYGECTCAYQTACAYCGRQCHGTHD